MGEKEMVELHRQWRGKLEIKSRVPITCQKELSEAYTPGVAFPCLAIQKDRDLSFELTRRWNTVAVVTDGTAVLGLGDIGPEAGMPVMEGKCALFKEFGDIDAIPLCIRSKDVEDIVKTVTLLAGSFGGVNLEDIGAPRCFEIERRLKESCDIPIFHDDQHGTAVVATAGVLNAVKLVGKKREDVKIVISGVGAAGTSIAKLLLKAGFADVTLANRKGAVYEGRPDLNDELKALAKVTNRRGDTGMLADVMKGADIFLGVSGPGVVTKEMVASMAKDAIVFAMANPTPEIMPEEALEAGAKVVGTGRSDRPNQVNNVLAFPGIFRGALDVRARDITDDMKLAAAEALAAVIPESELRPDYIIPAVFNRDVCPKVAAAVKAAAIATGVARIKG